MISAIISRFFILLFGTLYPAYASYKTVKTKNVKEYVKWMMYWIVFALFTTAETFTDVFLSWLPFYYEIKIVLVLWLLSPATKGSSILYRKFVHPTLSSREQEIDEYISKAKEQGYKHFLDLGQRGVSAIMQTAIKNISLIPNSNNLSQTTLTQTTQIQNVEIQNKDQVDDGRIELMRSQSAQQFYEMYSDDNQDDEPMTHYEITKPKKSAKSTKGKTIKGRTTRKTRKTEPESD